MVSILALSRHVFPRLINRRTLPALSSTVYRRGLEEAHMAAFHLPKSKCEKKVAPKGAFEKASFRWKKSGKGFILVGCPKGEWMPRKKRCSVGLRAHAVIVASKKGRCPVGSKRA